MSNRNDRDPPLTIQKWSSCLYTDTDVHMREKESNLVFTSMFVSLRLLALSLSLSHSPFLFLSLVLIPTLRLFFVVLALRSLCRKDIAINISRVVEPRSYARNQKKIDRLSPYLSLSRFFSVWLLIDCVSTSSLLTSRLSLTTTSKKQQQQQHRSTDPVEDTVIDLAHSLTHTLSLTRSKQTVFICLLCRHFEIVYRRN